MAEDWAKLIAEAKKLESRFRDLSLEDAKALWKTLQDRDKSMEAHEKALQKAAIAAYEAGVGSKKVAEFLKDKGFAAAFKLLEADGKLLKPELKQLDTYCDKCSDAAKVVKDLIADMDKALTASKGKDKSADRTAAKKARDALHERLDDLNAASNLSVLPEKYLTDFDKNFDKIIEHLIAEAFKKGKDPEAAAEIPQPLTEKKLQAAQKEALALHKTVMTCVEKMKALTPTDPKLELLSTKAWEAHNALRDLTGDYEGLVKKFKKELAAADPKGEAEDKVKAIAKQYDEAHVALTKADAKVGKAV